MKAALKIQSAEKPILAKAEEMAKAKEI